jgi:hypothetical protein
MQLFYARRLHGSCSASISISGHDPLAAELVRRIEATFTPVVAALERGETVVELA